MYAKTTQIFTKHKFCLLNLPPHPAPVPHNLNTAVTALILQRGVILCVQWNALP